MTTRSCRTKFRRLSTGLLPILLGVLTVGGLFLGAQPASAVENTCIQDVWKAHGNNQNLTCTAKDVNLSSATNIQILSGGFCENGVCKCIVGHDFTFSADFRMDLTADTRYDVGFYIATDGGGPDGALTGECTATASLVGNTQNEFINLDAAPDVCGDITGPGGIANPPVPGDNNPLFVRATLADVPCATTPGQPVTLPFCTTWRQPGSNETCTTINDVYPGSPSKCNCGTLTIPVFADTVSITVTKTALAPATVPETGGSQSYTVTVKNNAQVFDLTLDSLTDDKYGNITVIHAANADCDGSATPGVCEAVTATDCTPLPTITAGNTFSCTFTGTVPPGDTGGTFTDVVEACGTDEGGTTDICDDDDAVVTYTDVQQPPQLSKTATGAACVVDVTYTVVVTNTSAQDTLTLNTLTDDKYGSITSAHAAGGGFGQVVSTTCGTAAGAGILPASIGPSGNYTCEFVGRITSCNTSLTDVVTGGATDDDGASYTKTDDATVTVTVGGLPTP
jgi:hypothetical protein